MDGDWLVIPLLARFARNNAWANETLYAAVLRLSPEAFVARRPSFFPSIGLTLNHILAVDLAYLDALEGGGRGREIYATWIDRDAATLAREQAGTDRRLIAYCDADRAPDLIVRVDRGPNGVWEERVDDILAHLFQHQIHHRGQVHAMLSGTDIPPPQLDDFFLRFGRHPRADALLAEG